MSTSSPDAAAINKILSSVGIAEADKDKVNKLITELKGKDVYEVIASGQSKLASLPSGGGGGHVATSTSAAADKPAEEKGGKGKGGDEGGKKKKEEPVEEEDADMGFGLFD